MKTSEIKVGTRCWTEVSGRRVEVEVVQDRGGRGRRYIVKRVDNGQVLAGKLRSATALHASGKGVWHGAFHKAEEAKPECPATLYPCPKGKCTCKGRVDVVPIEPGITAVVITPPTQRPASTDALGRPGCDYCGTVGPCERHRVPADDKLMPDAPDGACARCGEEGPEIKLTATDLEGTVLDGPAQVCRQCATDAGFEVGRG